jgi:hypothetical protein
VLVGDVLGAIQEHNNKPLAHSGAGQGVGWFDRIRPTADVISQLWDEAKTVMAQL